MSLDMNMTCNVSCFAESHEIDNVRKYKYDIFKALRIVE